MAVAEYMVYKEGNRRVIPTFVSDCGHWYNPSNHTFIGWIEDIRDYYVPETIAFLDKQAFANRFLQINALNPMTKPDPENSENTIPLTEEEVIAFANDWFDDYVARNTQQ
jgi:hypothetical protein